MSQLRRREDGFDQCQATRRKPVLAGHVAQQIRHIASPTGERQREGLPLAKDDPFDLVRCEA